MLIISSPEMLLRIIKERRVSENLDTYSLASSANVSLKFISQLENGKITVETDSLRKVTQALGLRITAIDHPTQFGSLIRSARKRAGIDQQSAAAACNISPRFLSELERGKVRVRLNKLFDVATALGIKIEVII